MFAPDCKSDKEKEKMKQSERIGID